MFPALFILFYFLNLYAGPRPSRVEIQLSETQIGAEINQALHVIQSSSAEFCISFGARAPANNKTLVCLLCAYTVESEGSFLK